MTISKFDLSLDSLVYYRGRNVTGSLFINLNRPERVKEIFVTCFGFGVINWNIGNNTKHHGIEEYLKVELMSKSFQQANASLSFLINCRMICLLRMLINLDFLSTVSTVGLNLSISRQIEIGSIPYTPYQKPLCRRQPLDPKFDKFGNHFPQLTLYEDFGEYNKKALCISPSKHRSMLGCLSPRLTKVGHTSCEDFGTFRLRLMAVASKDKQLNGRENDLTTLPSSAR